MTLGKKRTTDLLSVSCSRLRGLSRRREELRVDTSENCSSGSLSPLFLGSLGEYVAESEIRFFRLLLSVSTTTLLPETGSAK